MRATRQPMSELAWLASDDPMAMLAFLGDNRSLRKMRLFACACCRQVIWNLLRDERARQAVVSAERFADGLILSDELEEARRLAIAEMGAEPYGTKAYHAASAAMATTRTDWSPAVLAGHAAFGAYASGERTVIGEARRSRAVRERQKSAKAGIRRDKATEAGLLRDIFGNPFRLTSFDPVWLTPTVRALANGIYQDHAFDRLPILADALEEAGCNDAEILGHLRSLGPHVRGCWPLDLLLAKE